MAIIEEQEDKWGPLQFIIVIDLATKKVENIAMLKYVDGRARTLYAPFPQVVLDLLTEGGSAAEAADMLIQKAHPHAKPRVR